MPVTVYGINHIAIEVEGLTKSFDGRVVAKLATDRTASALVFSRFAESWRLCRSTAFPVKLPQKLSEAMPQNRGAASRD